MEKPIGVKVAVSFEILILLIYLVSFFISWTVFEEARAISEVRPDISAFGIGQQDEDFLYFTASVLIYTLLIFGLLHLIPIYLLWQGRKIGKYIATFFAVLDFFAIMPTILLSIPVLYFIWFDSKTKDSLSG